MHTHCICPYPEIVPGTKYRLVTRMTGAPPRIAAALALCLQLLCARSEPGHIVQEHASGRAGSHCVAGQRRCGCVGTVCAYSSFGHRVSLGTLYRSMRAGVRVGVPAFTVARGSAGAGVCCSVLEVGQNHTFIGIYMYIRYFGKETTIHMVI
jgi:hypothetical protein